MDELIKQLPEVFSRAHPLAQLAILAGLVLAAAYLAYGKFTRGHRLRQMRAERDQARSQLRDRDLLARDLQTKLTDSEALAEDRRKEVQRLTEDHGRLSGDLARAREEAEGAAEQLNRFRREAEALQQRFDDLQKIDTDVWAAPAGQGAQPRFVPREERRSRFVAFLNLKGGVGKTTLVANLAGAYATGAAGRPLCVLVVDLDYQGTLSNMCVSRDNLLKWRSQANNRTSHLLLADASQAKAPAEVIAPLLAPFEGTGQCNRVIIADESLDHVDFRQQARFAVEHREVRFHHRKLLHDASVLSQFDFVFFDCPPRLTTSTVNALAASDFIVLPTSLHGNDVDAVPRTLRWLDKLKGLPDFQAKLAGVVLNRTYRGGTVENVTKDERPLFDVLEQAAQKFLPTGNVVLRHLVPNSQDVARFAAGSVPLGTRPEGHRLYEGVAAELLPRIR
jgi:cellulose biosynthesis protein BcsQ